MSQNTPSEHTDVAREPEDLSRLFLRRVNAGDVDGLVALYESDAVLATPDGGEVRGEAGIRAFYAALVASAPRFAPGEQHPALRVGDLALTSTRLPGGAGATAEVARQQPDGTWRWILDRPNVL
ncbi:YybH family protein [Pseudonocardia zijingensis]|jgi:ketosteroid isomerase-like protein|uniref:SnoaL-like domain-containing protein n=1 Tax=Pseudonocardia zijingensis TaxID=153376 RepID=A0ABN1PB91_9PSEU